MNRLAEEIKAKRIAAKLTEKELAKRCGLTASYIIQIELGKKVIKKSFAKKIFQELVKTMTLVK